MGYKEIPLDYTWDATASSFDVDESRKMSPGGIMRMQQEVGGRHLHGTNVELEALIAQKVAFLSVQSRVKIFRRPNISESFSLTTWARENIRARFFRCYQAIDLEGKPLFDSVTSFVYVNFETHKILRPLEFSKFGIKNLPERGCKCPDPEKLKTPIDLVESPIKRTLFRSDTDWNGHVNNTRYADIMFDYAPPEVRKMRLDEFTITFISECRLEDKSFILLTKVEDDADHTEGICGKKFWIAGEVDRDGSRVRCFEGVAVFKEDARSNGE